MARFSILTFGKLVFPSPAIPFWNAKYIILNYLQEFRIYFKIWFKMNIN